MSLVDDCCVICAEPLEWTGFGSCGHKEACSRCVARLRFLLKDKRCVLCQQDTPCVYFTRFMGDFTASVNMVQFPTLKARSEKNEVYHLPEIDGFFDDRQHYDQIKSLCSFFHPILQDKPSIQSKHKSDFQSLDALKTCVEKECKKHFCDLCLKGRKVFVCEQLLYTRQELDRHMKSGDEAGPLAECNFKGHPSCKFCHTRFYDGTELFRHMETEHEHCFLCRRISPGKYVYYRHYKELEEHFHKEHHACPHPHCLERRFVVFGNEIDLKRHFAAEHADERKMTRAEKREALNVPIQIQIRSREEADEASTSISELHQRATVVIGGGYNVTSRHGPASRGLHHAYSESQLSAALQASSLDAAAHESTSDAEGGGISSVTFNSEDFPVVSGAASASFGLSALGRWSDFAHASVLNTSDFPALPSMSKNAKRRLKQQQNLPLAARLAAANRPITVKHKPKPTPQSQLQQQWQQQSLGDQSVGTVSEPPSPTSSQAAPDASSFGAASHQLPGGSAAAASYSSSHAAGPSAMWSGSISNGQARNMPSTSNAASAEDDFPWLPVRSKNPNTSLTTAYPSASGKSMLERLQGGTPARPPPSDPSGAPPIDDFPELPAKARVIPPTGPPQPSPNKSLAHFLQTSPAPKPQAPEPLRPALAPGDFPSLPSTSKPQKQKKGSRQSQKDALAPAAPPTPIPASAGGVSQQLKAANKALVEKIRGLLSTEGFVQFKQESAQFMQGRVDVEEYHHRMVALGLLGLVAELAALCPDADLRTRLMETHKAYLATPAAQNPERGNGRWMPPEAAAAAITQAETSFSWTCAVCTLINAPSSKMCEACGRRRGAESVEQSLLGATLIANEEGEDIAEKYSLSAGTSSNSAKKKGGKGSRSGSGSVTPQGSSTPRVHPQNIWTQNHPLKKGAKAGETTEGAAPSGSWSCQGGAKLARSINAVQEAWSK